MSAAGLLLVAAVLVDHTPVGPPPPVTLPPAGGSYVDPVFGTTIIRLTDEQDGTLCVNAYSYWSAFNLDDTRLLIACDDAARLYLFDPGTDTPSYDGFLRGADGVPVQFEGASWSGVDRDVVFALEGTRLWRIDTANRGQQGYTLVRDFAGLFAYPFFVTQLQVAQDDRMFTFHSRDPSTGAKLDAVVYDRTADQVTVFDRGAWEIDETKIDKLGRYVIVDGSFANPGFKLWTLATDAVDDFGWNIDDKPGGHIDMGVSLLINGDGWDTGILVRAYDAPHGAANLRNIVQYLRPDGTLNWSIADHVSFRADAETFVVASTYGGDGAWDAFEDELYLAYVDGSGFARLAHSRSAAASGDPAFDYYAQPRAVVDRRGHYIVYTSDLGSTSHTDVMILRIPDDLRPPTTGTPDAGPGPGDPDAGGPGGMSSSGGCHVAVTQPSSGWLPLLWMGLIVAAIFPRRNRDETPPR